MGSAYRIWASDNNGNYPADIANNSPNSGWHDFVTLTNAGPFCWSNYAAMQNELGYATMMLICPSDIRRHGTDFISLRNTNISYFFNPASSENFPQSILGGDRNLAPGTTPKDDFGFSPTNGQGNDVILQTNSPVCWSLKIQSAGNTAGAGNILMGDGSVQQTSSTRLMSDYTINAATASNFPSAFDNSQSNSFRLIFP